MQNDLISRSALLKECEKRQEQQTNEYCDCFLNDAQEISTEWWCVEDMVMAAPTIDAVPVVHGRWVETGKVFVHSMYDLFTKCSLCSFGHVRNEYQEPYRFCPNCGAKMDGCAE